MTTAVIEAISRRRYDFSAGFSAVPIVPVLRVDRFRIGQLQVRLHVNGLGGASTFEIGLIPVAPSTDDPQLDFIDASTDVASVSLSAASPAPALFTDDFIADFGVFLGLWISATPSGGNCIVVVSCDLVFSQ